MGGRKRPFNISMIHIGLMLSCHVVLEKKLTMTVPIKTSTISTTALAMALAMATVGEYDHDGFINVTTNKMSQIKFGTQDQIEVTQDHIQSAASYLGTKIMYVDSPTQALIQSNAALMDRLDVHPLNRDVDKTWVQAMKQEVLKNALNREFMLLTVAVDQREIHRYLNWKPEDGDSEREQFKAFIIDGQHRWYAMQELRAEMPNLVYPVMLTVYIVRNDTEIVNVLTKLNKRREFTAQDANNVEVRRRFIMAMEKAVGAAQMSRRCVRSAIIAFTRRLKSQMTLNAMSVLTEDKFFERLYDIAAEYEQIWNDKVAAQPKLAFQAVGVVIKRTKLYMLCDDTHKWLDKI